MGRVAGKVALVAGAGGGIGGAGAEALAREGAAVFCTDRNGVAAEVVDRGGAPRGCRKYPTIRASGENRYERTAIRS